MLNSQLPLSRGPSVKRLKPKAFPKMLLSHRKLILLLLVLLAAGSIIYYLHKLDKFNQTPVSSTTSRLEHEIRVLQAQFESLVIRDLGALGRPARGNWTSAELEESERSRTKTGYNAWLSERISPERTLHDMRHRSCKKLNYPLEKLPSISVVIVYHNEQASVLLRTISSIRHRTPTKLLQEIILIDDGSEPKNDRFQDFVQIKYVNLVKHRQLKKHEGLMRARVAGAKMALSEVLVFLDAHVEVTKGWLEPLLVPLLENEKTCTTPIIDTIDYDNFAYRRGKPSRGFFDWHFNYIQRPLLKQEMMALPAPHDNPIMNGGIFAIRRQWFFDLGGYDEGLRFWGGEQFELSLKIWLCGGRLLQVPCSRVGHLYRDEKFNKFTIGETKAISVNYRRVAEVWLGDYKDKLFANMPHLTVVRAGSLKKQLALRERLHCKPFNWFLSHLASDFLAVYPIQEEKDYAFGGIRSVSHPKLCLDRSENPAARPQLLPCDPDLKYPKAEQQWTLRSFRDLSSSSKCLEVRNAHEIWIYRCHKQGGNQFWYYDQNTEQLVHGQIKKQRKCLELVGKGPQLIAAECDANNINQKWNFGYVNAKRLNKFWSKVKET